MSYQAIAVRRSLEELRKLRDAAIKKLEDAYRLTNAADELIKEAGAYGLGYECRPRAGFEDAIKDIDRSMWRVALRKTGITRIMDAKATKEFEDGVSRNPPAFSIDTVQQTLLSALQSADEMMARGVYELFRVLSNNYRTNEKEPFRVGKKVIVDYMVDMTSVKYGGEITLNYRKRDQINDIDRIFRTLDKVVYVEHSLESEVQRQWKETGGVFEDEYFRIKGFKKGTAHIEFKRLDLLERVNELIGEYCGGNALAEAS